EKQKDRISNVKKKIRQVITSRVAWLISRDLGIRLQRKPSKRMPVGRQGCRESPSDVLGSQATLDVFVARNVGLIVEIDEFTIGGMLIGEGSNQTKESGNKERGMIPGGPAGMRTAHERKCPPAGCASGLDRKIRGS